MPSRVPPGMSEAGAIMECREQAIMNILPVILGSAVVGSVITAFSSAAATRRAERKARCDRASDLLTQVTAAAGMLETERAMFRERRDSWRANLVATGQVMLELIAARQDGTGCAVPRWACVA
jgi:hypothetical protein